MIEINDVNNKFSYINLKDILVDIEHQLITKNKNWIFPKKINFIYGGCEGYIQNYSFKRPGKINSPSIHFEAATPEHVLRYIILHELSHFHDLSFRRQLRVKIPRNEDSVKYMPALAWSEFFAHYTAIQIVDNPSTFEDFYNTSINYQTSLVSKGIMVKKSTKPSSNNILGPTYIYILSLADKIYFKGKFNDFLKIDKELENFIQLWLNINSEYGSVDTILSEIADFISKGVNKDYDDNLFSKMFILLSLFNLYFK